MTNFTSQYTACVAIAARGMVGEDPTNQERLAIIAEEAVTKYDVENDFILNDDEFDALLYQVNKYLTTVYCN